MALTILLSFHFWKGKNLLWIQSLLIAFQRQKALPCFWKFKSLLPLPLQLQGPLLPKLHLYCRLKPCIFLFQNLTATLLFDWNTVSSSLLLPVAFSFYWLQRKSLKMEDWFWVRRILHFKLHSITFWNENISHLVHFISKRGTPAFLLFLVTTCYTFVPWVTQTSELV